MDWTNTEFFRPLVSAWIGKIEAAYRSPDRQRFREIADECKTFYARSAAAFWSSKYAGKFLNNAIARPKFPISINKAFELIAVIGPNLLWDVPHRNVQPKQRQSLDQEAMELLAADPRIAQQLQAAQQFDMQDVSRARILASLLQTWLNYTSRELPDGGLGEHCQLSIIDSLLTGRGLQFIRPYQYPASGRNLTGAFREDPMDLVIDPDVKRLADAKWIVLKHRDPYWDVERRFKLRPDSLKSRATLESTWHYAESSAENETTSQWNASGQQDIVVWFEAWSKMGAGSRMTGLPDGLKQKLQEVVGDNAYLAMASNVPYPLNCPTERLRAGMSDDEVRAAFSWPVPTWTDKRWPCEVVDYYPDPESPYPVAPLAPGMGELKFLNLMIPWLCHRIWTSSRDFWAVSGSELEQYRKYIENGADQCIIPVPPGRFDDVRKAVTILQQPPTNLDAWKIIEVVGEQFDRRTGLSAFLYGMKGSESNDRSAAETSARAKAAGVRPQYMQKRIGEWQSRVAAQESFQARWFITGDDVVPLGGQTMKFLWERFVMSQDVETVVRQMAYDIAAASIRRPDRDRDMANFDQAMQVLGPNYMQYALQSGDFEAWNELVTMWGELHDFQNTSRLAIRPQPNEAAQQAQQEQMALEREKVQAELQGKQMDLQGKQLDIQAKQLDVQAKGALRQMEVAAKQQAAQVDVAAKQADLLIQQAKARTDLQRQEASAELEMRKGQLAIHAAGQKQAVDLLSQKANIGMDLAHKRQLGAVKIEQTKRQAKAKPKPAGKPA